MNENKSTSVFGCVSWKIPVVATAKHEKEKSHWRRAGNCKIRLKSFTYKQQSLILTRSHAMIVALAIKTLTRLTLKCCLFKILHANTLDAIIYHLSTIRRDGRCWLCNLHTNYTLQSLLSSCLHANNLQLVPNIRSSADYAMMKLMKFNDVPLNFSSVPPWRKSILNS